MLVLDRYYWSGRELPVFYGRHHVRSSDRIAFPSHQHISRCNKKDYAGTLFFMHFADRKHLYATGFSLGSALPSVAP